MVEWVDLWLDEWLNGWTCGWMGVGWTNGWIDHSRVDEWWVDRVVEIEMDGGTMCGCVDLAVNHCTSTTSKYQVILMYI